VAFVSRSEQIGAARLANENILIVGGKAPDCCDVQTDEILNISACYMLADGN
jgi:hypothetical protein